MRKNITASLGFLIAPLFVAIALMTAEMMRKDHHLELMDSLGWVPIIYFYVLGATLIIGLPAYLFLRHFKKVTWWSAMFVGTLSGAAMLFISSALTPLVIPFGGLSGLVFWLIESRGR